MHKVKLNLYTVIKLSVLLSSGDYHIRLPIPENCFAILPMGISRYFVIIDSDLPPLPPRISPVPISHPFACTVNIDLNGVFVSIFPVKCSAPIYCLFSRMQISILSRMCFSFLYDYAHGTDFIRNSQKTTCCDMMSDYKKG